MCDPITRNRPHDNMGMLRRACLVAAMGGLLSGHDRVMIGGAKRGKESR